MWASVRLTLNIVFFLASLLCIFAAPTFHLWIASIVVSEFSWVFIVGTLLLLLWSVSTKKFRTLNTTLSVVSLITFATPIGLAWYIGRTLSSELAFTLGDHQSQQGGNVFSFAKLFEKTKRVPYETLVYVERDGQELTLDFYQSTVEGRRPCVMVIHGGSWRGGNSQQLPELNSELARQGFQIASINYRLAPKYKSPAPLEDIAEALDYLKTNAFDLKIDTNNFILLGRSAGAQLALVAAYTLPTDNIRGVVNFYGPTDMVRGYHNPANPYVMDSKKVLEDFLGGPYSKVPQNYVSSSPVAMVKRSIPTLIIHGRNDALVDIEHGRRLERKLEAANIPHYLLSLPWATHGCDYTLNGPSGQLTTFAVEYFAKQVISGTVRVEKSSMHEAFGSSGN